MTYRSMQQCVADLKQAGHLVQVDDQVDPHLEAAEIQRRVFASGGPAIYFANVKDCQFPMVSNLFGTMDRVRFIFRNQIEHVRRLISIKSDPDALRAITAGQHPIELLRPIHVAQKAPQRPRHQKYD